MLRAGWRVTRLSRWRLGADPTFRKARIMSSFSGTFLVSWRGSPRRQSRLRGHINCAQTRATRLRSGSASTNRTRDRLGKLRLTTRLALAGRSDDFDLLAGPCWSAVCRHDGSYTLAGILAAADELCYTKGCGLAPPDDCESKLAVSRRDGLPQQRRADASGPEARQSEGKAERRKTSKQRPTSDSGTLGREDLVHIGPTPTSPRKRA